LEDFLSLMFLWNVIMESWIMKLNVSLDWKTFLWMFLWNVIAESRIMRLKEGHFFFLCHLKPMEQNFIIRWWGIENCLQSCTSLNCWKDAFKTTPPHHCQFVFANRHELPMWNSCGWRIRDHEPVDSQVRLYMCGNQHQIKQISP
jgi:hypothetical protein